MNKLTENVSVDTFIVLVLIVLAAFFAGTGGALTGSLIITLALFALWYAYYFRRGDVTW